jgi:PAS domain S-box-containing protein
LIIKLIIKRFWRKKRHLYGGGINLNFCFVRLHLVTHRSSGILIFRLLKAAHAFIKTYIRRRSKNIMSKETNNIQKNNETSLMQVFMSAPALLCIVRGHDHVFELANTLFRQFVGNKAVINKSVREAVPELEGQGFFQLLDNVYATGETRTVNEMPLKLDVGNGTFKEDYFKVVFQPMYDANERVNGIYVHAIAVTEQVLTCKKNEENAHRLTEMVNSSPSLISIFKGENMIVDIANAAILESWGKGNIIGQSLFDAMPETVEQGFDKLLLGVYETGEPVKANEMPITLTRNGIKELIYYDFIYQAQRNKKGDIEGVAVLANEVTQQVRAKNKLLKSEKRFRNLVEQATIPMLILKGDNWIVELVNEPMLKLWNVGKEAIGKPMLETLPELNDQPFIGYLSNVLQNGVTHYGKEEPAYFIRKNGEKETIYFNFVYQPYHEDDGSISGVMVTASDVTEQVVARKKIEASKEQLQSLFMQSPFALAYHEGPDFRLNIINEKSLQTIGKTLKEVIGKTPQEVVPDAKEQGFIALLEQVYHTGIAFEVKEMQMTIVKEGVTHHSWWDFTYTPISDANGHVEGIISVGIEVTDKLLANEKISESEKQFRNLVEQAPVALCFFKGDNFVVEVANEKQLQLTGRTKEQVMNIPAFTSIPETAERYQDIVEGVYKTGIPFIAKESPFTILHDGKAVTTYINFILEPFYNAEHKIEGVFSVTSEVTEQVLARKKIEESENEIRKIKEQLELSLTAGKIGLWHWDVKTDELQWSNEQKEMYGMGQSEELNGLAQIQSFILPEDWERIVKNIQGPNIVLDQEYDFRIKRKNDGEIRWLKSKSKVLLDENGNIESISGVNIDISEQVYAMNEIKESENRFRTMADASPVFIWTIDANGLASYYNKTFLDFIGISAEEDISNWGKIVHPDDVPSILDTMKRSIAEHHFHGLECRLLRADGQWRWALAQGNPRMGANNEFLGFVGSSIDITERKLFENKLIEANELAENVAKSKQQFLSNMSHEIRTPMNAIVGFTNVVLKTTLDEKQKEYINAIKASGESLLVLINDILDLAKVDAGKMVFQHTPFKLSDCMTTILHLFDLKIKEKNIALVKEYDATIPEVLLGDPVRLQQILMNLISNALKFTEHGQIMVRARVLNEDNERATIEFTISDTGIGIAKNKLNDIFGAFEQAHLNSSLSYGGTGLGLAIVKQLVEHQGGSVSVHSKEGEGSAFGFVLSFEKTEGEAVTKSATEETPTLKNLNILVAEDVKLNQLLIRILLEDFGVDVDIVDNGKIAIEKLKTTHYDIILMDLQMPEMNGFEATAYIRNQLKSKIPIIALTADVTTVDVEKCKAVGMNDYISKPIDEKLLYEKIIKYLPKAN